ncbi:putative small nuclear ribonucleoprotein F [Fulvia fulva]|uniref:Sm protein F n=1 Tax=Passalora fulva TaxID=5499 RepID=A0A9Q8PE46_PASFU|nr:putative small nuclear ribonucleoprotein F [Fulvia fulva]KAK4618155.1 putative small nuclear ribonucleoprotein F [Fulvia fulva]KAK4618482.1 putative small nuclear ribonucleoprotein F [Fulvia fulva]UJO20894.1 putative small nuclear ribonucleoprotein F [Fulvia fulva]WPV18167.1 putative small nuclear ribonucleoprotein F [Fulvia fulva]WPV33138.1 putative small nuclear ribonucleoprotein F [Fulvia fulva]
MSFIPLNPRPMLQSLVDKEVIIRIKWGQEYTGRLVSVDSYMNIQLSNCSEWKDGQDMGVLGQVLIRCNNVLWISARNQKQENGDSKMED